MMPLPQKINQTGVFTVSSSCVKLFGDDVAFAADILQKKGVTVAENAAVELMLKCEKTQRTTYIEQARRVSNEKFIIEISASGETVKIVVTYAHRHGLFYALECIGEYLYNGEIPVGEIVDYPLFKKRGYIEGFYGKPWTFEERTKMIALMAQSRMNSYFYAPKDDPYHREKWRDLYPEKELGELKKIIGLCGENFVEFTFCIAPGLSMCYSSEDDYNALLRKVKQLYNNGVNGFGLLLDDIPETLYFECDKQRFDNETVNAHIWLSNRLYDDLRALDPAINLTVCPMQYHGNGDEYFISRFGSNLDPMINIFWTGHNICSQELTCAEAAVFERSTLHRPLYWDNFPVNDCEMYNEMHMGYLYGREKELYAHSEGLISNCMEYAAASAVPLLTVADYLWNPLAYNPRESWKKALATCFGDDADKVIYFTDNLLFSCLKVENSSLFNQTANDAQQAFYSGDVETAVKILNDYIEKLNECCDLLKSGKFEAFASMEKWIDKQLLMRDILVKAVTLFDNPAAKGEVQAMLDEYLSMPAVLMDFSFQSLTERLLEL